MAINRAQMRQRLQRRRRDPGFLFHNDEAYNRAINVAIDGMPFRLWRMAVDTSVSTSTSVKGYSLAGVTGFVNDLDEAGQVVRVEMEDSYGDDYLEIGRCEVVDDEGVLTLELDEYPPEAGRTLRIHWKEKPALTSAAWDSATVPVDDGWVEARAMVLLLGDANPRYESPEQLAKDLSYWGGRLYEREAHLGRRRKRMVRSARTQVW